MGMSMAYHGHLGVRRSAAQIIALIPSPQVQRPRKLNGANPVECLRPLRRMLLQTARRAYQGSIISVLEPSAPFCCIETEAFFVIFTD